MKTIIAGLILTACLGYSFTRTGEVRQAFLTPPPPPPGPPLITDLTEAEAVELAEKFIVRNGYTDAPPDREHLDLETIEWESNIDAMLRMRHDSLASKAYGVSPGRQRDDDGWTVAFRFKHPAGAKTQKTGRAVTMNADGSEPRVEHKDVILEMIRKKL